MTSAAPRALTRDPIAEARISNERTIAKLVLTMATIGVGIAIWRSVTVETKQGLYILAFAVVVAVGYGASLVRRGPRPRSVDWALATFEVSATTIVVVLDAHAGTDFLLTSSTSYMYALAIMITTLRLDARLTAYATLLAITQHLGVFLLAFTAPGMSFGSGGFSDSRLYQELSFRCCCMAAIGFLGAYVAVRLRKETTRAADEQRVRTAFGNYVDQRVVQRVLAGDLRIAPERREVTLLFVDVRDFTRLAETRDASEVFKLLSGVLQAFSEEVQRQGGIVNKFLGDGLFAIFGAPEEQPDHIRRAVRCALNIAAEAEARAKDGRFPGLRIGIGVHSGPVVVGDLGGERREFTAIGDAVNVASRIESANKQLGTTILVTAAIVERLGPGLQTRKLQPLAVKGRDALVEVYELQHLASSDLSMGV